MKKILLIAGTAAALILTGCNQGGTSDQYGTSSGTASNGVQNGTSGSSTHSGANGANGANSTGEARSGNTGNSGASSTGTGNP